MAAGLIFALPFGQLYWLAKYINEQETTDEKIGTAVAMVPIFLVCTFVWATAWLLCFAAIRSLWLYGRL
jgi:hypothetical protein